MEKFIDKELLSYLLKLEFHQQEMVLAYIKELLSIGELDQRAAASEKAITSGKTKKFDNFNTDFENWKIRKRAGMK